jgi:hypothetical protein
MFGFRVEHSGHIALADRALGQVSMALSSRMAGGRRMALERVVADQESRSFLF